MSAAIDVFGVYDLRNKILQHRNNIMFREWKAKIDNDPLCPQSFIKYMAWYTGVIGSEMLPSLISETESALWGDLGGVVSPWGDTQSEVDVLDEYLADVIHLAGTSGS